MAGLFYFIEMHKARRALSAYGLESLLKPLPWGKFFGRKGKKSVPLAQDCRVGLAPSSQFRDSLTFCEWLAGVFFSAHPEIVRLPALPPPPDNIGNLKPVLTAFYTIAKQTNRFALAESFERFVRTDKRLEAADLERVRDSFYDWDGFCAAEPDWVKTTEKTLVLSPLPPLKPLTDPQKLSPVLTTMIFRDGFFVLPFSDVFGLADDGGLWLAKAPVSVKLSPAERRFVNAFYPAFIRRDFKSAAKACLTSGFAQTSPLELIKTLETADDLFESLAPFDLPLNIRFALKTLRDVPPTEREMNLYADTPIAEERADIETVLKMPDTVARSFAVRRKKPAAFVTDAAEVSALLRRNEYAARFRVKKRTLVRTFLWTSALLLALYLLKLV